MPIEIHPLSPERWHDLETVFAAKGCSVARGCWCMYYRESGGGAAEDETSRRTRRRDALRALAEADPPPGLLGYEDGRPVGWVALGPREDYPRLRRSPVARPVDAQPVWSLVCFVVPGPERHRGFASALLRGAIDFARARGATLLEAYPIDKPEPSADDSMWNGALSMYTQAGFTEVARRRPQRPVVRLVLAGEPHPT